MTVTVVHGSAPFAAAGTSSGNTMGSALGLGVGGALRRGLLGVRESRDDERADGADRGHEGHDARDAHPDHEAPLACATEAPALFDGGLGCGALIGMPPAARRGSRSGAARSGARRGGTEVERGLRHGEGPQVGGYLKRVGKPASIHQRVG